MNGPISADGEAARPAAGPTLEQRVAQLRETGMVGLPLPQVARIVSEIAVALDRLHTQGRTHGDVQASQISVPTQGQARLLEATQTDTPTGGVGDDVLGLVSTAYYALCGAPPSYFHPVSSQATIPAPNAPASFPVSPSLHRPELSSDVCDVFTHGLSPRPQDRYATAGDFAAALSRAVGLTPAPSGVFLSPKRVLAAVAAVAVLTILVFGLWLGHLRQPPSSPPAVSSASPPPADTPRDVPPASVTAPPKPAVKKTPRLVSASPIRPPQTPVMEQPAVSVPEPAPAAPDPKSQTLVPDIARVSAVFRSVPHRKPPPGRAYLRVYARQFVSMSDVVGRRLSPVPARRVLVDGAPSQALTLGHWASITPGRHKLAYYPAPGIPFDPNTKFWVQVRPRRRSAFQVPLPRHPGGVPPSFPEKIPPGSV